MRAPAHVVAYVSGHGLGHATRSHPVVERLLAAGHRVTVVSLAPPAVFRDLVARFPASCALRRSPAIDPSVVQRDALTVDSQRTFAGLRAFLADADAVAADEAAWLRALRPPASVVFLDSPPLPAKAAKMAGVPSVLVSNFSFDTILDALDGPDPEVVAAFRNLYAHVSLLLKLPGNVGMDRWERSGSTPVEPMPLVARTCRRSRDDVRRELHLPLDAKCLLITFGGFQMATDKVGIDAATALPDGWLGIVVSAQDLECTPPDRFRIVPPNSLFMPDVINASDVVLGKLGYGTCSEAVAHGVPMLYVVRPHFIEESGLLDRLMRPHGVCLELARADFDAGRWASSVLAVRDLARSQPPLPIALDGAERVAQRLVALAQDTLAPA